LDGKISSILGKHHKDYVATFNEFMMAMTKDLREKIESLEEIDNEKQKSEDVENLKTERNFFRKEAIRLNTLCMQLTSANEQLTRDNKYKAAEIKILMKKWKESEATSRQLLTELERNLKSMKNLENEKKQTHSIQAATGNLRSKKHLFIFSVLFNFLVFYLLIDNIGICSNIFCCFYTIINTILILKILIEYFSFVFLYFVFCHK